MELESAQQIIKCEICDRSFSTNHNKKVHVNSVHKEEKYFICNVCNKEFGHKNQLKKHIMTVHNWQINYKCDYCGKSFTQSIIETKLIANENIVLR